MKPMIFLVVAAALLLAASTYWSPYHSCVRALVGVEKQKRTPRLSLL